MFAGSRLLLPVLINCVTLVPKPGRKEGHAVREPSLLRGIAVLRRSGSRKKRRSPVAARGGGAGAMEAQVGRKARCRAPGTRRGGCRPRGSGGVAPFAWRPKPAAIRHVWGGAGNGGLAAGCPRPEEPPPSARRQRSIGPSTKDVQYHRMAPRVSRSAGWGPSGSVSGNRTEIFIIFFFFTFKTFNNKINKHNRKAAAPHGRLPHTKHKLKFQAWSSLLFHCCHSSFNPSEAPPWDSRPVSGAGVVHYQLLHRPRSVPTALGPAPLVTDVSFRRSQEGF